MGRGRERGIGGEPRVLEYVGWEDSGYRGGQSSSMCVTLGYIETRLDNNINVTQI